MEKAQIRKLPFWRTVGAAYRCFFSHFGEFFVISRLWILIAFLLLVVVNWIAWPWLSEWWHQWPQSGSTTKMPRAMVNLITALIWLPIVSSIAVAWHRYLLVGERVGYRYLRWDSLTLTYALLAGMVYLPASVGSLLTVYYSSDVEGNETANMLADLADGLLLLVSVLFLARCSLILPAKSVGHEGFHLSDAVAYSRRNSFRMLFGVMLATIGPALFYVLFAFALLPLLRELDRETASLTWTALQTLPMWTAAIAIGFLSFSYDYLVRGHEVGETMSLVGRPRPLPATSFAPHGRE